MDQTSAENKQVTIIYDIVLSPQKTSVEAILANSEVIDLAEDDCIKIKTESTSTAAEPQLFKNLFFELPTFSGSAQKRKQPFSALRESEEKRIKTEDGWGEEGEHCDDDAVERVFNYMTGTYETIRKSDIKAQNSENSELEHRSEDIAAEKKIRIIEEETQSTPCLENHLLQIDESPNKDSSLLNANEEEGCPSQNNIIPLDIRPEISVSDASPSPIHERISINSPEIIPMLDIRQEILVSDPSLSSIHETVSITTPEIIPPSQLPLFFHDENSNTSLLSITSPTCNSPPLHFDESSSDTIITGTSTNNPDVETIDSSTVVESGGIILKELFIKLTPLSLSSEILSQDSNNLAGKEMSEIDQSRSNVYVEDEDVAEINRSSSPTEIENCELEQLRSSLFAVKECIYGTSPTEIENSELEESQSNLSVEEEDVTEINGSSSTETENSELEQSQSILVDVDEEGITEINRKNSVTETGESELEQSRSNFLVEEDRPEINRIGAEKVFVTKLRNNLSLANWDCKTCGIHTNSKKDLILHIYNTHLKEDYEMKIKCKNCHFECDTPSEMEKHEISHQIRMPDDHAALSTNSSSHSSGVAADLFCQNNISISRSSKNSLIKAFKISTETRSISSITRTSQNSEEIFEISVSDGGSPLETKRFQCFLCSYKTNGERYLKCHAEIHSEKKYYCKDHFWTDASATCPRCIFEKILFDIGRNRLTKTSNKAQLSHLSSKKRKINSKVEQNENTSVGNQSTESSLRVVQDTIQIVNMSLNKEILSRNASDGVQNVTSLENTERTKSKNPDSLKIVENSVLESSLDKGTSSRFEQNRISNVETPFYEETPSQSVQNLVSTIEISHDNNSITSVESRHESVNISVTVGKDTSLENHENVCNKSTGDGHSSVERSKSIEDIECRLQNEDTTNSVDITLQNSYLGSAVSATYTASSEVSESLLTVQVSAENSTGNKEIVDTENTRIPRISGLNKESGQTGIENRQTDMDNDNLNLKNVDQNMVDTPEIVKNAASNSLKRKNPDNLDSEYQSVDSEESVCSQGNDFDLSFKCFDCNSDFSKKDGLKIHALSCHPDSLFQCHLHKSKINFHECEKCIYELIFRNCGVKRVAVKDLFDVTLNKVSVSGLETPKRRSMVGDRRRESTYKETRSRKVNSCETTDESDFEVDSTEVRITRARAGLTKDKPNYKLGETSDDDDTSSDYDSEDYVIKTKSLNRANKTEVKCLECNNYSPKYKSSLKLHVSRHVGSKFRCIEHYKDRREDCSKCCYEMLLQNVSKEAKICKTCGYRTIGTVNFIRHTKKRKQACTKSTYESTLRPEEILCFKCMYVTSHKELLKYHMVDHLDLEFSCENHLEKNDEECLRCIYEECLEKAKKDLLVCKECRFKTVNMDLFKIHGCAMNLINGTKEGKNRELEDSEDNVDGNIEENIEVEIGTSAGNIAESSTAEIEIIRKNPENHIAGQIRDKKSSDEKLEVYKCFDCEFSIVKCDLFYHYFKNHVCRHIGSKFQCMEHLNKILECPKCYYEITLHSFGNTVKTCGTCGYKTNNNGKFIRHQQRAESCKEWSDRLILSSEVMCFKCHYITSHKEFLKYHMIDHVDEEFSCKKHRWSKDEKCLHCINQMCLESAKMDALMCKECGFKTVIQLVLTVHKCSKYIQTISEDVSTFGNQGDSLLRNENLENRLDKVNNALERNGELSKEIEMIERDNEENNSEIFKCFDCKYCKAGRYTFKRHILRHVGSKFQCFQHWDKKVEQCPKCYYEIALQNFNLPIYTCETCGFRSTVRNNTEMHKAKSFCEKWSDRGLASTEVMCFKCQYITTHRKFLKYHMVDHLDQGFSCKTHPGGEFENCLQCINQECLESAQKEALICKECNFKTVIRQIFEKHKCTENEATKFKEHSDLRNINKTAKKYKCFDCDEFVTENLKELGTHVTQHTRSELKCIEHYSRPDVKNCLKCIYENLVRNSKTKINDEVSNTKSVTHSLEKISKCFDCSFSCKDKWAFPKHVCRHLGSKFQCIEHHKSKLKDCPKCHYEKTLEIVAKNMKFCRTCGYKTTDMHRFKNHKKSNEGCSKWLTRGPREGELRCLECQYATAYKKYLKYHMVDHLDSMLSCKVHCREKNGECESCLNEQCLWKAKKEVKTCEKCNFKTVIKKVFDIHDCEGNIAANSKEGTKQNVSKRGCDSNETSRNGTSVEENTNETVKKYKCFDCTEFVTDSLNELRIHTNMHNQSNFQCNEHCSEKTDKDCSKCIYQAIVKCFQNTVDHEVEATDTESNELLCSSTNSTLPDEENISSITCSNFTNNNVPDNNHRDIQTTDAEVEENDSDSETDYNGEVSGTESERTKFSDGEANEHFTDNNVPEDENGHVVKTTKAEKNDSKINDNGEVSGTDNERTKVSEGEANEHLLTTSDITLPEEKGNGVNSRTCSNFTDNNVPEDENGHVVNTTNDTLIIAVNSSVNSTIKYKATNNDTFLETENEETIVPCLNINKHLLTTTDITLPEEGGKDVKSRTSSNFSNKVGKGYVIKTTGATVSAVEKNDINSTVYSKSTDDKEVSKIKNERAKVSVGEANQHLITTTDRSLPEEEDNGVNSRTYCNITDNNVPEDENRHVVKTTDGTVSEISDSKTTGNKVSNAEPNEHLLTVTGTILTENEDNDINLTAQNNIPENKEVSESPIEDDSDAKIEGNPKCFDCKYFSQDKESFEQHICLHLGSKFQCIEHWENKYKNCLKCYYEELLKELQEKVKICNICGYKAVDKLSLTRHLQKFGSCNKWVNRNLEPGEIRCLECKYVTTHKKYLTFHMVDHLDLRISCDIHCEDKNEKCEKCINEECLESARKEAQICERCNFKTVIKHIFNIHNCAGKMAVKSKEIPNRGISKEICDAEREESGITKTIVRSSKKENASSSQAENTKTNYRNDNKNTQEICRTISSDGTSGKEIGNVKEARCFDCKFVNYSDKLYNFQRHICRHLGSKYQCMEHLSDKQPDCLKCHYEVVLNSIYRLVKRCLTCGFKTIVKNKMSGHQDGNDTCTRWFNRKLQPEEVKCFECHYVTTYKKFLKYHMVDHFDQEFSCKIHLTKKDDKCLDCINEECLEKAKKEALICKKCDFKTVIKKIFKFHECKEKTVGESQIGQEYGIKKYTCFDCNKFTTGTVDELEKHAMLHYKSSFQCVEHCPGAALEECSKCMYQKIVKSVLACDKCQFKTCSKDAHDNHDCIMEIEENQDTIENIKTNYRNDNKNTQEIDRTISSDGTRSGKEIGNVKEGIIRDRCFDCKYVNYSDKLYNFQRHICRHLGSKYQCMEHLSDKQADCLKCHYEVVLNDTYRLVNRCLTCGFTTIDKNKMTRHQDGNDTCTIWFNKKLQPEEVKCFECHYVTTYKKFLKYHMVDHFDQEFSCKIHLRKKDDKCLDCINEECLEMAKKEALICKKCHFKTVIKKIFKFHECKEKTVGESEIGQEYGIKKYTCFDCNKFTTDTVDELEKHAMLHYNSSFQCVEHCPGAALEECSKCMYQKIVKSVLACDKCQFKTCSKDAHDNHDCIMEIEENQDIIESESGGQSTPDLFLCFYCDYRSNNRTSLKEHAMCHYGKTFKCDDHSDTRGSNCKKCVFERILKSYEYTLKICDKCQYKTLSSFGFEDHVRRNACGRASKDLSGHTLKFFKCFDCGVTYQQEYGLKNHSIKHIGSTFKCNNHSDIDVNCQKCIYEDIVKRITNSSFMCKQCGYTTYSWLQFRNHKNGVNCQLQQARLLAERKSIDIPKNKTYQCFDCEFIHESRDFLVRHIMEHADSKFRCDEHEKPIKNCPKCLYRRLLGEIPRRSLQQCFDCEPPVTFSSSWGFKKHLSRFHPDSYFICAKHWNKDQQCARCVYEYLVRETNQHTYRLICCDCKETKHFGTKRKLKDHIKKFHLQSEFGCNVHPLCRKIDSCHMCLYEELIKFCNSEKSSGKNLSIPVLTVDLT